MNGVITVFGKSGHSAFYGSYINPCTALAKIIDAASPESPAPIMTIFPSPAVVIKRLMTYLTSRIRQHKLLE